jgi:hypothetical protein
LHTHQPAHNRASLWLCAILGAIVLSLAIVATAHAETGTEGSPTGTEGSPNDYECHGQISAGAAEVGSSEQQVRYTFSCNGPITGYQLETNVPLTGFEAAPIVSNEKNEPLSDTFSCGGELPGWADNCEGSTKQGFETITGQFSIGTSLCSEPRLDPLLTVTDIYTEKGVATQAISGPFDLGRPHGCGPSTYTGGTRLEPTPLKSKKGKHKKGKKGKAKSKKGTVKKK